MIKQSIYLILILLLSSSCDNDEIFTTGTLQIEFENAPISVSIYPLENQTTPLFNIYMEDTKRKSKEMNMGNYYCVVGDISTNYTGIVFQIQSNKTTTITYTEEGSPTVTYSN